MMAGQYAETSSESFEYMLLEKDTDSVRTVFSGSNLLNCWIDPSVLRLKHRIGRGPFGDVWLATLHQHTEDYDRYHEVAVKRLYEIKEDQLPILYSRFDEIFSKCLGIESICFFRGISIQDGRVCIVLKFYEGSIGDKMARIKGGKLPLSDVLRYGVDLARGVVDLHSKGIFILNLKPCNFLLDDHDHAVLGEFGIPFLLSDLTLPSPELVHRLGTPNYMAPEQWFPAIRGPISYETDSWGFGCSIVEMLTGVKPWDGKTADEIHQLVTLKKEKPSVPTSLPPEVEDVLVGCFEYDCRNRPLMADILHAFERSRIANSESGGADWSDAGYSRHQKSGNASRYTDWSLFKDILQVGDTVRSRKLRSSPPAPDDPVILEGTVTGVEDVDSLDRHVTVRIQGLCDPLRVHASAVQRVSFGFAAGDWVQLKDGDSSRSRVGIVHEITRSGEAAVGLIGMKTLWKGSYSELELVTGHSVGHFVRLRADVLSSRFEWPGKKDGVWAAGRVLEILSNGCLVVSFPGKFTLGEGATCLADPSEVELVSFDHCDTVVKKYQHLEDYHWAVRPLVIAVGLFVALRLGLFARKGTGKSRNGRVASISEQAGEQPAVVAASVQEGNVSGTAAWLPSTVAGILYGDGPASHAR